jgi:hypothetical protein
MQGTASGIGNSWLTRVNGCPCAVPRSVFDRVAENLTELARWIYGFWSESLAGCAEDAVGLVLVAEVACGHGCGGWRGSMTLGWGPRICGLPMRVVATRYRDTSNT